MRCQVAIAFRGNNRVVYEVSGSQRTFRSATTARGFSLTTGCYHGCSAFAAKSDLKAQIWEISGAETVDTICCGGALAAYLKYHLICIARVQHRDSEQYHQDAANTQSE
ncbi:hypothetical protein TNCV_1688191 [Trichonephila clavipes]|nr:hypothetical protein TNCV_1688191 [Trichonephila clavipes]